MATPFIGEIRMFAASFAPQGWALCDGQLLAVSQNDALFSLFGTIYGGDGRTTFGLPDLRSRTPIHMGSGPGLTPRNIGSRGGSERVTITSQTLATHKHTAKASSDTANASAPLGKVLANTGDPVYVPDTVPGTPSPSGMQGATLSSIGGTNSHENMMPFEVINFIVSLFGIYPSRN